MRSPVLKRAIDIVGASVGLALGALPMAVVAVLVRRRLGRPVLFHQERPGRDSRPFTLHKFRTMRDGPGTDEERLGTLGATLRAASLDELPELWNVLRGDMSLVGPRPLKMQYLGLYSPRQARRHEVRPGITGLAQIAGRNLVAWDDRLELDVEYVDSWTVAGDLKIMLRTVTSVLRRDGIAADGHVSMPDFEGSSA